MKIKRIIAIFENSTGRHYGFRVTRCSDGKSVEGKITGGESNILAALTHDGKDFVRDYYWYKKPIKEKELFAMPHFGSAPDQIREAVKKAFTKRENPSNT